MSNVPLLVTSINHIHHYGNIQYAIVDKATNKQVITSNNQEIAEEIFASYLAPSGKYVVILLNRCRE